MKQVLIRRGQAIVETVPAPLLESGHVLIEVAYSLISTGTELSGLQQSGRSLVQRAVEQPDKVIKLLQHLREQGIQKTVAKVRDKVDTGVPTGYSCSGIVMQVGEGVTDLVVGDYVACAGAGIANHAEIVLVPRNLLVKVPAACSLRDAASVTLGAIAMQGVRRADPRLGEIVAVIGLGLLGQLTVQILKAAGCRVVGIDLDAHRVNLARQYEADYALLSSEVDLLNEVYHLTGGHGVDAVIITASAQTDAIVQQAMEITRKKGRVVVVGAVGLGLKRSPFYEKELDFLISCSYGPGRYDAQYEEAGIDYPYAYVRWTENRNMAEYLRLVGEGKIKLEAILEKEYALSEAEAAYASLQAEGLKPLSVLLRYPVNEQITHAQKLITQVTVRQSQIQGKINVAIIGAGGFAKAMHLPNLQKLNHLYHIRAIVSGTGSNAKATAQQFGAGYASSAYEDVLNDPDVHAVLICTRHHLHAEQAMAAAKAGKAIFLEKPMATEPEQLANLVAVLEETKVPFVVGFNRRFSPAAQRACAILAGRHNPLMILYRVNAGYLPADHWTHGPEGGGRMIGEACHMFDLCQALVGNFAVEEVTATALVPKTESMLAVDNVATTIRYIDGSVATVLYTASGASNFPKEHVEIYVDGKTLVIDDYKALQVYGTRQKGWNSAGVDKGHFNELGVFANFIKDRSTIPISLASLVDTTNTSFIAAGKSFE
ncbi:MAG: oxidoreductase [Caldilinea sp. CFX5]|nr:oxidoreductase [Caldilinea sp. CFX5]